MHWLAQVQYLVSVDMSLLQEAVYYLFNFYICQCRFSFLSENRSTSDYHSPLYIGRAAAYVRFFSPITACHQCHSESTWNSITADKPPSEKGAWLLVHSIWQLAANGMVPVGFCWYIELFTEESSGIMTCWYKQLQLKIKREVQGNVSVSLDFSLGVIGKLGLLAN